MKVAVIGAGIFGLTIAYRLKEKGINVEIFERNKPFMCASGTNQFRLHRGYHYPRSVETIKECLDGELQFREEFPEVVLEHDHYYAIAKEDSFLNAKECKKVWDSCGLEYTEAELEILNKENVEQCFKVKESIIDPHKFKEILLNRCKDIKINYSEFKKEQVKDYDYVVNATYSNINHLTEHGEYQFELIEKLILELPKEYKDLSVVIQDGPFCCIDPYGKTGFSLMGNVKEAIHHRNIGLYPEVPREYEEILNKGIIENPKITKINNFLDSAEVFFPNIKKAKHIGSMFTIRAVLPYREKDDARPTIIEKINNIICVFSGKIPTCIDAANKVLEIIK